MISIHKSLLIPAVAASLLSACFNDSGDAWNITAESVSVTTPDPRIAYPLEATVSLTATQPKTEVPVSLFAFDKSDDPDSESRQIPLGTVVLEQVKTGTHDYKMEVVIPASVQFAGPYYINAYVDPADVLAETDEDDNAASTEVTFAEPAAPNILLADVALDRKALIINTDDYDEQVPDPNATDDVYAADAGGTITVGANGLALGETVDIEAYATLKIKRSDNGTSLDMPLYLWNSAEGRYTNAFGIDPKTGATTEIEWLPMGNFTPLLAEVSDSQAALDDVRRDSEHMEFYFPGKLGSELEDALRYPPMPCTTPPCVLDDTSPTVPPPDLTAESINQLRSFLASLPFSGTPGDESAGMAVLDFEICVDIRSTDPMINDDSTEDNEVCNPIDIYLPPLPGQPPAFYDTGGYGTAYSTTSLPWSITDGFATRNNNYYFGFNIDFSAGMSSDDRGFIGDVTAGIPVKIVGYDFDLMRIEARAQLVPDYSTKPASDVSGFSYEVRFLNQVVSSIPPTKVALSHSLLTPNLLSEEVEKFSYSDEVEKEVQTFVGPVPLIGFVFIGVNYGLDYNFGYADDAPPLVGPGNAVVSLGATVGPFANLEGGVGIGIGTKALSAGVEGVLTLLDIRLPYFIGADIELLKDDATAIEFITTPGQKLSLNFTGPQGALNLFVKYTTIKKATCKIAAIKYKCFKVGDVKRTLNLYTSPALFALEYVLWEDSFVDPLDVVILSGKPTAYFIEP
jgi:hypothetical protein